MGGNGTGKPGQNGQDRQTGTRLRRAVVLVLLFIVLLLVIVFRQTSRKDAERDARTARPADTSAVDTLVENIGENDDTLPRDTALVDSTEEGLSGETAKPDQTKDTVPGVSAQPDTASDPSVNAPDSIRPDTVDTVMQTVQGACGNDTVPPWVYPDPSGGLHRNRVEVMFTTSEPCSVLWRRDSSEWNEYTGPFEITETGIIEFHAWDTCGNYMKPRKEHYEIDLWKPSEFCPDDMEYIEVGASRFCIDRFEWPNQEGKLPQSFISVYHAMDSCYQEGKRLCTLDEWVVACSGPYSWDYPYGDLYEPYGCASEDSTVNRSGKRRECRGYFDVYDMSGNLAEWTSTRSSANSRYYNVMGGFWQSGSDGSCKEARYSYYPENRHNPVGFRCCKDAEQ